MKKMMGAAMALVLALGLGGCLPAGTGGPAQGAGSLPTGVGGAASSATEKGPGAVTVLLPAGQEVLEGILTDMAAVDGTALSVIKKPAGSGYAEAVQQALAEETPPDLVWMPGENEMQLLGQDAFCNLLDGQNTTTMQALAGLVPAGSRLLNQQKVYGLPVGYYAQGYLVNLELLAKLLNTSNLAQLQSDLARATWRQWVGLASGMQLYLQQPRRMQLKLANTTYTTPAYRPSEAQGLRGVFSVADGDADMLVTTALLAAQGAMFEDMDSWLALEEEDRRERTFSSLAALYGLLDFETMHMARREGVVWRGEVYAQRTPQSAEEAMELFSGGTALFLRADSRTGQQLERENPALWGKLGLVPVKLPVPEPEEEAENGQSGEEETEEDPSGEALDVEGLLAEQNGQLWYASEGYLCLAATAAGNAAAQTLLLRLFTTTQGIDALSQGLGLQVFTSPVSASPLMRQVAAATQNDAGGLLFIQKQELARPVAALGKYVTEELMGKEEWTDEEEGYEFLRVGLNAFGLYVEVDTDGKSA